MAYRDKSQKKSNGIESFGYYFPITTSNADDLPEICSSIYVGVSGDIKCRPIDGADADAVVFKSVPVGIFRVRTDKIFATGTTATNMIALY